MKGFSTFAAAAKPMLLNEVQKLRMEKDVMKKESDELRARLEKIEAFMAKGIAQ